MPSIRGQIDIETWFVEDLIAATSKSIKSNKEITIPQFQRGLVWDKKQQEDLIESIKNGYPIGTLLLYEVMSKSNGGTDTKRSYNLIDGLQRTNALKQYATRPNSFFNLTEDDDNLIDFLAREMEQQTEQGKDSLRREITRWVESVAGFELIDGWNPSGLTNALISEVLAIPRDSEQFIAEAGKFILNGRFQKRLAQFLHTVQQKSDITKVKVPIIIFTGDASELPDIFARLNKQGTVLSRYEVFAAQWMTDKNHRKEQISNKTIRDAIWKKYAALEDESFTSDASEDARDEKTRKDYKYTLFEYLFGFGQFLSDRFPRLFGVTAEDRPSSAGFNLMCACVGLPIKEMHNLPQALLDTNRNLLEDCIVRSIEFVEETLDPVLSVKQQKRRKPSLYHTEYQIISMIATALRVRFDEVGLDEIEGWRSNWDKLRKHLLMNYLYDILREYWRGSGDSKLHESVKNERYLNSPPNRESWKNTLENWFTDNQITLLHKGRYVRDQNPEILLLKYIYAHRFSLVDGAKNYHVEHIVPVNQLKSLIDKDDKKLAINIVSNLALLSPRENVQKGDLTFVEYVEKLRTDGTLNEVDGDDKLRRFEKQLICRANLLRTKLTESSYDDFVMARFDQLKSEFLGAWRDYIPLDPQS